MAKKVDITEKLSFEGNPSLVIKGRELEVNADAATVLKVMGVLSEGSGAKQAVDMYNLIFPEDSRKVVDSMNLNFKDFRTVVENAISLITGTEEESRGEAQTHATT